MTSPTGRNPTWSRDELILALDLYLKHSGNPPQKHSSDIVKLSDTLNRLARQNGTVKSDRFRNCNGVYMKLMNFRRLDPVFSQEGKVGLERGGRLEEAIWEEFAPNPSACGEAAKKITNVLQSLTDTDTDMDTDPHPAGA